MNKNNSIDVAIIGAGPSGLMATKILNDNNISNVIIERGDNDPNRKIIEGVGGAGLYSDGKFSFYPAGTLLWKKQPNSLLRQAYETVCGLAHIESLPNIPRWNKIQLEEVNSHYIKKTYPSYYIPFEQRLEIINDLTLDVNLITNATVVKIELIKNGALVTYEKNNEIKRLSVKYVVMATGRLWDGYLDINAPTSFLRYEAGIRIQQPTQDFIFNNESFIDPKYIYRRSNPRREYRTFCVCKNGRILATDTPYGILLSGARSYNCSVNTSNFGLMVRYLESPPKEFNVAKLHPFELSLTDVRQTPSLLSTIIGDQLTDDIIDAVQKIEHTLQMRIVNASILGPCIEGVGRYIQLAHRSLNGYKLPQLLVCGDATGQFRGLVPALVSGALAGLSIVDMFESLTYN